MKKFNDLDDFIDILVGEDYNATMQLPDPQLVQYYNDLENRTIWICEEIGESTLDIVSKIVKWNREDKGLACEMRKPIKLLFFSPGGSLDIEEAVVSVIRLSQTPIYGIALGMVASAASLIYLSCHKRYALPNAYFVLHKGSCQNISGDYENVQNAMEDYKRQIEKLEKFYIEYTNIPEDEVKNKLKSDWYIRGEELIEKGLVHEWIEDIDILL